jgi:hypothetical protein
MVLTFRSTRPEKFELIGTDEHGRRRVATATKNADEWAWQLELRHPSGQTWAGSYSGKAGILDALATMLNSHDAEFTQDRENGDRPRQVMATDRNRRVDDGGNYLDATITPRWDR